MSRKKTKSMRQLDPQKTPKAWEKARRERMRIHFNELQEILPLYDPSAPMSRFEVLQKSRSYIKDLEAQNQDLLNGGFDEVYREKMEKLKQRVKELQRRVDQLTDLLRTAGITIPPLVPYPENQENLNATHKWMNERPKKWTKKINEVVPSENIENFLQVIKDYKQKSNKVIANKVTKKMEKSSDGCDKVNKLIGDDTDSKKKKSVRKFKKIISTKTCLSTENNFTDSQSPSHTKENQPIDFNLLHSDEQLNSKTDSSKTNCVEAAESSEIVQSVGDNKSDNVAKPVISKDTVGANTKNVVHKLVDTQSNIFLQTGSNVVQSNTYILTNDGNLVQFPIINSSNNVYGSNLLTRTTVVNQPNQGLLTPLVINRPSPLLVLQKPAPPQIIQAAQIVNPTPQILSVPKPSIQILGNSVVYANPGQGITTKCLPQLLSKPPANKKKITRDSTVTTYVNKIPIPALSKQSYSKKSVSLSLGKTKSLKTKETGEKVQESEKQVVMDIPGASNTDKEPVPESSSINKIVENNKEAEASGPVEKSTQKRSLVNASEENAKKCKLSGALPDDNVFKPIENPLSNDLFCNLKLPNTINPSLSISPTAAFLSSFPIVALSKSDESEEPLSKCLKDTEKKSDEEKDPKIPNETIEIPKEISKPVETRKPEVLTLATPGTLLQEKPMEVKKLNANNHAINNCNPIAQPEVNKSWTQYQPQKSCEVNPHQFFPPPVTSTSSIANIPMSTFTEPDMNVNAFKNAYVHNAPLKNSNTFEYPVSKNVNFQKKSCPNVAPETYNLNKTYHEPAPNYQLIPAKEMTRNARPPVNWMTDPDVRSRSMNYVPQPEKPAKTYTQSDMFYPNQSDFVHDNNKVAAYQKNEFYVNKSVSKPNEKRSESKCVFKPPQNSYNIFDYNYNGNCFPEEDPNKYCNFTKSKKNTSMNQGKKKSEIHQIDQSDPNKRNADQILPNFDFNHVPNQECLSWVPGKNVEWLPGKSFNVDTNLVVPSTLPTLVGDLALGTNSSNDLTNAKAKPCQANLKPNPEATPKQYIELGLSTNPSFSKNLEPQMDHNKQFLEPFANLSKNIFDVTPTNNVQNPQILDKTGYGSNTSNETIVLKNIFELPAVKTFPNEFQTNRNKQRGITNPQNTFLSVSQLVETPEFENNSIKNETLMESRCQTEANKPITYSQTYPNYQNTKHYKNKSRNSHCKYTDRKYHGYNKNGSSNYTAEALIRSNTNVNYHNSDFTTEVNPNFFNKNNQKTDNFVSNNELSAKSDFVSGPYTEFNFSSPVPNFNITPSMNTDFTNHDGNFSTQNNAFFGDFIPPEYPLTDNVSNSLLLPPCSIGLQNPFIIDKRTPEKNTKNQTKHYSNSRNRKHFECSKSTYNDFSIVHNTTGAIFTNSTLACPPIFTTSSCQNLLPVPNQNVSDTNITFSGSSFSSNNIAFPPLSTNANTNFHRFSTSVHNTTSGSFLSTSSQSMFTTCSTTTVSSTQACFSTNSTTSVTNSVITTPFSVGNTPFSSSSQSGIPFLSLSNPIITPSMPTTSGNTVANFNLSTIFPEINQKGNYHYP